MPCTTILVGAKASNDGSTMIARNDDCYFDVKKLIVVNPKDQPRKYKCAISHLTIELPDNPMRYTSTPNVDLYKGKWAANGINEANVGMTATETITSNPRVYAADPLVQYEKASKGKKEKVGGIGEEDLVMLVLPYIHSAREGVLRLASLLEKYGTYEMNGIAFNDEEECWWMETIGGHHWIARRVKDNEVVIMPNQFGMDHFDFADAFGDQKENMCSADLREFIDDNDLYLGKDGDFNPRLAFGSSRDSDHVYNTPRAWYMGRFFCPTKYSWDGEDAMYKPESNDIPWSLVPEKKVTVEDVKYILSSYYQGTPYNPYVKAEGPKKGIYRPIAVANTAVMAILQIRPNVPKALKGIEWICFGSNAFNTVVPLYANVDKMPSYFSDTKLEIDSNTFYWGSRLLGVLADAQYASNIQNIERYQLSSMCKGREIIEDYDGKMIKANDFSLCKEANEEIAIMIKKLTNKFLGTLLLTDSDKMKNRYYRADN